MDNRAGAGELMGDLMDELFARESGEDTVPIPKMPEDAWGATGTKWSRYTAKTRALCADCTQLIHELGQGRAPLPERAHWRRKGPNDERLLCNTHAEERKRYDARATGLARSRQEIREHESRAERASGSKRTRLA